MKIILTGASGNLGKEIQKLNQFEIVSIDRQGWDQLKELKKGSVDAVIHCAYDLKNNLNEFPTTVLDSNILSTARMLEICKMKEIKKFVFISSCSVYGESSNSSEEKECHPITMNGHTKHFNEQLIKSYCQAQNINYLILRAFNSYGGDDQFSVVQKIIKCSKENLPFTLVNKGVAERDFIHISDVAKLSCQLTAMELHNEIVNIGSGNSVKIKDIIQAVEKKFGPIKLIHKELENEAIFSRANIKKLNQLLEFRPVDIFDFINSL